MRISDWSSDVCSSDLRDLAGDLHDRDREHDAAGADDESDVATGHAVIDDVGVEAGQIEHRDSADELQRDDDRDPVPVGRVVGAPETEQHQSSSSESVGESITPPTMMSAI